MCELAGGGVEVVLVVAGEVGAFGEPAAQQAVEVLVDGPLPRRGRIGEVHVDVGVMLGLRPCRHLTSVVPG